MPEICRFYGIIIALYYNEHNPHIFMQNTVNLLLKLI